MATQLPDGTVKKRKTKPKPKVERPEIILVTPKPSSNLVQTTEFELFRAMIDDKPRVAMRVANALVLWDGAGHPSRVDLPIRTTTASFLDYLTDEEGVFIPGSAEERVDPVLPEIDERPGTTPPVPPNRIELIPDGISYKWGPLQRNPSAGDIYDAQNHTQSNGRRFVLLYSYAGYATWTDIFNEGHGFLGFIDNDDEKRWQHHNLRDVHMV